MRLKKNLMSQKKKQTYQKRSKNFL